MIARIMAVRDVKRLRGGSQPHLMECSDGQYYIVKFQNNPQGIRILANEMLCTLLAAELELPVPRVAIVEVCSCLIHRSDDLVIQDARTRTPCIAGLCFGSRHVDPQALMNPDNLHKALDTLSDELWLDVDNVPDFAGMMVLDKWACNTDDRQVVFGRGLGERGRHATMVDNGFCFNAAYWNFPDTTCIGVYSRRTVYKRISGIEAFEPWLWRLEERLNLSKIIEIAETVPPEWYGMDVRAVFRLLRELDLRRLQVRRLISLTLRRYRHMFSHRDTEGESQPVAPEIAPAA